MVRLYNQKSVKTIGSKVIRHHFLTNLPIYLPTSVNNAGSPDNRSELEQKFAIYLSFLYIFDTNKNLIFLQPDYSQIWSLFFSRIWLKVYTAVTYLRSHVQSRAHFLQA